MALLLRATPPGWWMAEMFLSAPVIFLARVREPRMVRAMPLLGVAIAVAYQFFYPSWQTALIGLAYGLGASSIVVAVLRIAEPEEGGLAAARTALVVAMFPAKFYCGFLLLTAAAAKTPQTFDTILTSADKSLGGSLSFAIGRFASASPAAHFILVLAYNSLPTAVMFVAFLRWRRFGPDDEINIPLMVIIAAVSGVALYSLAPAAGPAYRWGTRFPFHPPSTAELVSTVSPVPTGAFRNAMPSLHFAGAVFIAWGTQGLGRWQRSFGMVFLVLTFAATLGTGEHYLIDLIVAVPFSLSITAAVQRWAGWPSDVALGCALVAAWFLCFRLTPRMLTTPVGMWIAVTITLMTCAASFLKRPANFRALGEPAPVAT